MRRFSNAGTAYLIRIVLNRPLKSAGARSALFNNVLLLEKETHQALAYLDEAGLMVAPDCNGVMTGYEIHMGVTTLDKECAPSPESSAAAIHQY